MKSKKISIIIPVYGEDEYISACIESVVNQTYGNIEVILVDDGSPDQCPVICDEWALRDQRIKVIHKENGGLVSARQAGMESATGDYVGYVDGDDWIEPEMYENMIQIMESEDVDIVISGFKKDLFGKSIPYYNKIKAGIYRGKELETKVFPFMICDGDTFQSGLYTYVWNKLFKKEKVFQHQMSVDKRIIIGEDSACVYPTIFEAESIAIITETGYHYRQRMNSLLRKTTYDTSGIAKLQLFYKYMSDLFANKKDGDVIRRQIDCFYIGQLLMMSDSLVAAYPVLGANFPFLNVSYGSRVIIYSAGAYGIHVYQQFSRSGQFMIVAWVDPDFEQYSECEYPVISLEEALKNPFDVIIIASIDLEFVKKAEKILIEHSVAGEKIIMLKQGIDKAINKLKTINIIENGD